MHYNPDTGLFTRLVANSTAVKVGDIICAKNTDGYMRTRINGKLYNVHRLAWLYMTGSFPEKDIDHQNHKRNDNRWNNLRSVSRTENQKNRSMSHNNTSGFVGVSFYLKNSKWRAQITINGKRKHLGYFVEKIDAIKARKKANKKYNYHENHGV